MGHSFRKWQVVSVLALLSPLAACGDDVRGDATAGANTSGITVTAGLTTPETESEGEDADGSAGDETGMKLDTGGGSGPLGAVGYIWIANSAEGTVSKIRTETMVEEGRYLTRPDGAGDPSRTSVSLRGNVAVAN